MLTSYTRWLCQPEGRLGLETVLANPPIQCGVRATLYDG